MECEFCGFPVAQCGCDSPEPELVLPAVGSTVAAGVTVELERLRNRHQAQELFQQERIAADLADNQLAAKVLTRSQLSELPEPEPLIDETLDRRTVAMLAGSWGTGKTFLALDWAACVATGHSWVGRQAQQGTVIYVAAEGANGLHARLTAWEMKSSRQIPDESLLIIPLPVQINAATALAQLCAIVKEAQASLVVLDTLARSTVGMDESGAPDMGLSVDALYQLRDATQDGTVLVIHHTGKDGVTIRGSSALEGGLDTVYLSTGEPEELTVTRLKRKEGPTYDEVALKLVALTDAPSAVLMERDPDSPGAAVDESADSVRQLISILREHFGSAWVSQATLRNLCVDELKKISKATFFRAVTAAVESGFIEKSGSPNRQLLRLKAAGS